MEGFYSLFTSFAGVLKSYRRRFYRYLRRSRHVLRSARKGFTRYLRCSRVFLVAAEGDFIDICVVRGMFCLVDGRFYSLFTSFAGVFSSCRRRFYRYSRRSRHVLPSGWEVLLAIYYGWRRESVAKYVGPYGWRRQGQARSSPNWGFDRPPRECSKWPV